MDLTNFDIRKQNQIIDGKYIGYHSDLKSLPIQRGDIIVISKGIKYHSMKDGQYHTAKKTYTVKVDHLIHGAQYMERSEKIVKNTEVTWAGSGGYWCRADINKVKKEV
jgi:hypothetical protein